MLRKSLTSFVEGYDAADASDASCFALLQEMLGEEGAQSRIKGGYAGLMNFLKDECRAAGCIIHLSTIVSAITWRAGEVMVTTSNDQSFTAPKAIVTVPLSILQLPPAEAGHIAITPMPPAIQESIRSLGNTGVIKVVLQFTDAFWKGSAEMKTGKQREVGFVFGDAVIPTWWTQLPEDNAMITGWLAGPASLKHKDESNEMILQHALASLSKIFSIDISTLAPKVVASHIMNWITDPFTRGAYAYEKVGSKNAKRILNTPLADTLFFAGEALHEGPERGTVEGALLTAAKIGEMMNKE